MSEIQVTIAGPHERPTLENLLQLYIHDFSEHWAGESQGELREDGRFEPYPLDDYWTKPCHAPLLLRRDGALAGFALLNAASHVGGEVDHNVAEFFIARKHRRGGAGTAAAHAIFGRYPGRWEAAVARRNIAALAFWRKTIASHAQAEEVEEIDVAGPDWNGPVIRFRIRSGG